jgi:hypothetical protein
MVGQLVQPNAESTDRRYTLASGVDDFDEAQPVVYNKLLAVRILYCRIISLYNARDAGLASLKINHPVATDTHTSIN